MSFSMTCTQFFPDQGAERKRKTNEAIRGKTRAANQVRLRVASCSGTPWTCAGRRLTAAWGCALRRPIGSGPGYLCNRITVYVG